MVICLYSKRNTGLTITGTFLVVRTGVIVIFKYLLSIYYVPCTMYSLGVQGSLLMKLYLLIEQGLREESYLKTEKYMK